jgi:ferritin-like metal-binding protein YciE
MPTDLLSLFFRKLRMLYCSELQLISFLPELTARASERSLRAGLQQELELSRQRRDTLEIMAAMHRISSAGDDCDSMRRLIDESREALRAAAWHFPGDDDLRSISGGLHRLQILNYGVARSLANRVRLTDDVEKLDGLLDLLLDRYPETCDAPVPAGLLARDQPAYR